MKKAIVGKKIGMTQVFTEDGRLVPVTVIEAGPCTVVQKKTVETDGYEAVQVGFGALTENRAKKLLNKPEAGHFKKAGVAPMRTLREFRFDDIAAVNVGDIVRVKVLDVNTEAKRISLSIREVLEDEALENVPDDEYAIGDDLPEVDA